MGARKGKRLVDGVRHAYAEWQWRSAAVWASYERWSSADGEQRTLEFAGYRVALDLEERACRQYMELAQRVSDTRRAGGSRSAAAA